MNGTPDPVTVALTGALPLVLVLGALLALLVSAILLRLYRRSVLGSMSSATGQVPAESAVAGSPETHGAPPVGAPELSVLDHGSGIATDPAGTALYSVALRAPWRAASIYAVAGFCYSVVMAVAFIVSTGTGYTWTAFLLLVWTYAWPVTLAVVLVAAATRRSKLICAGCYFVALSIIAAIGLARSPGVTWPDMAGIWFATNTIPTVLLLVFLNRRIRAVGPLVLAWMLLAVAGSQLVVFLGAGNERLLGFVTRFGVALGLGAGGIFVGVVLLGFAVLGLLAWPVLRGIGRWYERKWTSDQSITLDSIWMLFAVLHTIALVFEGAPWILSGVAAFAVYKAVSRLGLSMASRGTRQAQEGSRLLLLRVFSLGRRSERLFDAVTKSWRYAGSIELITGPDLATTTIEPHEFLDFLTGKLSRRFIDGAEAFRLRLSEMDIHPDPDGRFRVNEFFCRADTWQMVMAELASESDSVLMDLRGFAPQNAGCIHEIDELIQTVPLGKVVFTIDETTDEGFLRQVVQDSWSQMKQASPNWSALSPRLSLFRYTGSHPGELQQLLRALCAAAVS